jgi:hypothetical protein
MFAGLKYTESCIFIFFLIPIVLNISLKYIKKEKKLSYNV